MQNRCLKEAVLGQPKIISFFSPAAATRVKRAKSSECDVKVVIKKSKRESKSDSDVGYSAPAYQHSAQSEKQLSPEQKQRASMNKMLAAGKLLARKTHGVLSGVGPSWQMALETEFSKPYFLKLCEFVENERLTHTVYPSAGQVFTWTNMSDISNIKVVILGQDPYHGAGQAHGLCFSVPHGIQPPPSLQNIFKELSTDIEGFSHPGHGNLSGWAEQGVLLLNAVLTVRAACANSHKDRGWEILTDAVIAWLNSHLTSVVFLLWGAYAQKKGACIDKKKHLVLSAPHPSPLSAHRGFLGCRHFSRANQWLQEHGKEPIDWTHHPASP